MSFNAGGSGTAGFSFNPPSTSASSTTGFSFASPTSTASGGIGGFSFAPQATTSSTGFSFNRPTVSLAAPVAAASASSAPPGSAAFSFSNPSATTSQSGPFGSSLIAPPQTAAAITAPGSGFSFAAPISTTSTGTGGGFSFNVAATTSNAGTAAVPGAAFSFAAPTPGAGTTATTTTPSTLFNFAPPKPLTGLAPQTTTTQGLPATTTSASGVLPSLFAPPASQAQPTIAPTSILGQAMAKTPSTSNVAATSTPPSLPAASTPLLGTVPATSTVSLPSVPATTAPLTSLTTATSSDAQFPWNSPSRGGHQGVTENPTLPGTSTAAVTGVPLGAGVVVVAAVPTLSVRGLEEKVNKWVSELREQEERLMRQAAHVNSWDQLLQQGHDEVQQLRDSLTKVKVDQQRLQAELDFIQGQQQELEQLIEPLEAAVSSTTPAQHQGDRQRENMHHLAQNLDAQLHQMTEDLCKVIEHLNSNNSTSQAADPVNTVARVLSAHMDTLKWVDQNCALLTQKIDDLSRTADSRRRD